jgi:hypothetical protein
MTQEKREEEKQMMKRKAEKKGYAAPRLTLGFIRHVQEAGKREGNEEREVLLCVSKGVHETVYPRRM